eukprot:TRINITY_DN81248_c0_g1_i1.p1 TRINITY_DN81248_c0_g1~~TRINITY_DN81248_c0_g1_i1.p1  ORF type:complete len:120 (-),score=1.84 TRINITY_DN81248_c0_g1_i1:59-418(-)
MFYMLYSMKYKFISLEFGNESILLTLVLTRLIETIQQKLKAWSLVEHCMPTPPFSNALYPLVSDQSILGSCHFRFCLVVNRFLYGILFSLFRFSFNHLYLEPSNSLIRNTVKFFHSDCS